MTIPLISFEQDIEEVILERGWQYFKNGHVTDFDELSPGEYEAIVEGTEEYEVSIQILDKEVIDPFCTCPYEGPVCEHVAAVIFYYKKVLTDANAIEEEALPRKKSQKKKVPKKKSAGDQVEEILKQLSAVQLEAFVKEQIKRNEVFARAFLSQYAYLSQESSKEMFARQLQEQLRSLKGRQGWIDYYQSSKVYSIGREFYETAASHFQQKRYSLTWHMACAALEVFTGALEYTDDSKGDVGACITDASQLMVNVAEAELPEELRKECFRYCANAYGKKLFSGWDWHELQMDIAIQLVNSKDEAAELHSLLDMVKPTGKSWDYGMSQAEVQRYCLFEKTDGVEKANEFLQQNLHNSELRKQRIEQLIVAGRYDEAIRLAEEGIKKDEKEFPGRADEWRERLLKIYLLKRDTDNIIKYAFHLFVYSIRAKDDLYDVIKEHIPVANWGSMVQQIIHAIRQHERFGSEYRIAGIYLREQYWDELFGLIRQNPSLNFLDEYEEHLPARFGDDINKMYMKAVTKLITENTGRKFYETACQYLLKLKKRGAKELVAEKIKQLRHKYPRRRALLDELNLVCSND